MYSIFRDPLLRTQIERDGYLKLPILGEAALAELRKLFEEVRSQIHLQGFATTTTSSDLALKQNMFARIAPLYRERLDTLFEDYKSLGVSFLQKDAGAAGHIPLHQDWTVTEEAHFRTFTIWIPMEDCGEENGALQMLPGSHRWMNLLRGPNLPIAITDIAEGLRPHLVTVPLRAGEGILFDHAILHTSTVNVSNRPRIAITYGLTHRDTPLRFWYHHPHDPMDRFEQIAVPDDFFLRYHQIGKRPDLGRSLGFYRQDLSKLKQEDIGPMVNSPAEQSSSTVHRQSSIIYRPILRDLSEKKPLLDSPQYPITKNADWNQTLAEKGYITFPLLNPAQVAQLTTLFTQHQSTPIDRFYASVHHPDIPFRHQMDAAIQAILRPLLATLLDKGEALGASFIAKPKGNPGILPPHADWNIVDERTWRSYNLWIPLVDTTVANGAVHIIPGSHNWLDYYRGPGIPNPFEPWKEEIWKAMVPLELPAGTALLYDHRLLHASPANQTDTLRIACVTGIKHRDTPMRYYYGAEGVIKEYVAHPGFFMTGNPEVGPGDLEYWGEVTDRNPSVTLQDLQRFLGVEQEAVPANPERGFWQTYTLGNMWREFWWRVKGKK